MSKIKRKFTLDDQIKFASFSGDYNPIHINIEESKKTHAGEPIVYGIYLIMWALESLKINIQKGDLLTIDFNHQVNLEKDVKIITNKLKNFIQIVGPENLIYSSFIIHKSNDTKKEKPTNKEVLFSTKIIEPEELNFEDIEVNKKYFNLLGGQKKQIGKKLFPYLTEKLGSELLYEIASLSSIVGMKIPGRHSLFAGLKLSFIEYQSRPFIIVKKKHKILKHLLIEYSGINLSASIKAFVRPKPVETDSIKKLKNTYKKIINIKNTKVLIIGGSRGLGAYITKLSLIMGARVTFTYCICKNDALEIFNDATTNNYQVTFMKLNINKKQDLEKMPNDFDMVYYLATPKIHSNKNKFNFEIYEFYKTFYVKGFSLVVDKFLNNKIIPKFFFPSSIFINESKKEFKEYIKAKTDGEKICDFYKKKHSLKIIYPRIPQLETDQNLSILPNKTNNTAEEALKIIKLMVK